MLKLERYDDDEADCLVLMLRLRSSLSVSILRRFGYPGDLGCLTTMAG